MESTTNLSVENKENEVNIYSDPQSQLSRREQLELWKQSKQKSNSAKKPTQSQKPNYKRRSDIFIVDKETKNQNSVPSSVQPKKEKPLPRASLQPQQIHHTSTTVNVPKSSVPSDLKQSQVDKRKSIAAPKPNGISRPSTIPQEKPEITSRTSMAISTPGRESFLMNSSTPRESMSVSREERLKLWRLEREKQKIEELQEEIAKATKTVMKKQQQFESAKKHNVISHRPPTTPSKTAIIIQPATDITLLRSKLQQIMNLESPEEARQQFEDLLQDPSLEEVNLVAEYWVTRARFEEQQRNFAEVVRLYEQASQLFAQPIADVEEGLRSFMLRLKDSYISKFKRCAEELAEFQERTEFDANFSSSLDFTNPSQRNSPSSKTVTATEEQMQLIKDLVNTLSKNPLAVSAVEESRSENVVDQAVNIIETAFQAQPVTLTCQTSPIPVSLPAPSDSVSIDSISLDKYLQIEDTSYESKAKEDRPELLFNDPVLRILTPPRKSRKSSLAMRKSTPKPQRVLVEENAEEEKEAREVVPEEPLSSSVVVLAPVPASQKQKKALGSAKILTPVRRSTRLSTSTRMVPLDDESLSQVLEETGYAYSPNLSVQKKNKGFKVMFAENVPSQTEAEEEDEFAKYLRTPVSKPPQTPLASETKEREIQTSLLQFPVENERVVQRLFTDNNDEHDIPQLDQLEEEEEEEEIKTEEPEHDYLEEHSTVRTPFSELGRYDTLASIVKSGRKSSSRKSVRIVTEETPSRSSSWHNRRKSTPCPTRVKSSSPVAITPVRRSVRLSVKKSNEFDLNDPHGPVTFTPNRFIPDLAEYLKPEVEHLIKENPQ